MFLFPLPVEVYRDPFDVKPFNPAIDYRNDCRTGWTEGGFGREQSGMSDERFVDGPDRPDGPQDPHDR